MHCLSDCNIQSGSGQTGWERHMPSAPEVPHVEPTQCEAVQMGGSTEACTRVPGEFLVLSEELARLPVPASHRRRWAEQQGEWSNEVSVD